MGALADLVLARGPVTPTGSLVAWWIIWGQPVLANAFLPGLLSVAAQFLAREHPPEPD